MWHISSTHLDELDVPRADDRVAVQRAPHREVAVDRRRERARVARLERVARRVGEARELRGDDASWR